MRDAPGRSVAQYVFFIDRSLGSIVVPEALRHAGVHVEIHASHFADNTPDTDWLSHVGQQGWVVFNERQTYTLSPPRTTSAHICRSTRLCPCSGQHFRAGDGTKLRQRPPCYVRPSDAACHPFYRPNNTARTYFYYQSSLILVLVCCAVWRAESAWSVNIRTFSAVCTVLARWPNWRT